MNLYRFLQQVFTALTARPRLVVLFGFILIALTASGLTRLVKDTSVDAFVPEQHPSLLANEQTTELFGLSEPIAVAVFTKDNSSVFAPTTVQIVHDIALALGELDNVRADRVASIASESSIRGTDGFIDVENYIDIDDLDANYLTESARRWRDMLPHVNTLVSADETGAVIMAELIDSRAAAATYQAVQELVAQYHRDDVEILVAGPAAVSGYLSEYIDADARVLQPVVFVIVMLFLYFAFMRSSALLGPVVVLLGSAGGAMGIMAWQGVPYYAITNALPVILVAISVADAIHILSAYFERRARFPDKPVREVVIDSMITMARPISLTTITTMAGFFGIAMVSIMPPIAYFSWYAMLGVFLAWFYSLFILPAVLVLVQPKPSPLFAAWGMARPDPIAGLLGGISRAAANNPAKVLTAFVAIVALALLGASDLRIDRSQVDNFAADEPIRIADERIHDEFAGTAFLDVIITSDTEEGVLTTHRMQKIASLQAFLEAQEHVSKTASIVDYLSLLHTAIEDQPADPQRPLPAEDDAIAQYLMVYEASGDPSDLDEEITPDYQAALVRGVLNSHYFSDSRQVVTALEAYLQETFNEPGLTGTIAGDVNVAYHWMTALQESHFKGVGLSLLLILIMAMLVFRSPTVGLIAVVPVTFTVLCIYGMMGSLDVYLEPATSMFAAISVGVGVDFAIHLVDRLQLEKRSSNTNILQTVATVVPGTARACFFNAAALGVGFSVLMISDLPMLQRFGGLVTLAALASFLAALIIVPACYALLERRGVTNRATAKPVQLLLPLAIGLTCIAPDALADTTASTDANEGLRIAQAVAERIEAAAVTRTIDMTLTDKRGRVRQRQALVFRQNEDKLKHTRITYMAPKAVRELTFLSRDFKDNARADERWLYIPAARKVRRIPASDRGDYFLGTDFTFEDMQSDLKFDVQDYHFTLEASNGSEDNRSHLIRGQPVSRKVAKELGYGGFRAEIDVNTWFPTQIEFFDLKQAPLKTIKVSGLHKIDGVWTPQRIEAEHHRTGHHTRFDYSEIRHSNTLPETLFNPPALTRGLPKAW